MPRQYQARIKSHPRQASYLYKQASQTFMIQVLKTRRQKTNKRRPDATMDDFRYRRHPAGRLNEANLDAKKQRNGVLLLHHDTATTNTCINTQGMPSGWSSARCPCPSKGKPKTRAGTSRGSTRPVQLLMLHSPYPRPILVFLGQIYYSARRIE